jgi:Ran GTPase-activating protein (RanGAP) involved in mRNA processing and transport
MEKLAAVLPDVIFYLELVKFPMYFNSATSSFVHPRKPLPPASQLKALEVISLAANELKVEGFQCISPALPMCSSLKHLNLSGNKGCNGGNNDGFKHLCTSFAECTSLEVLNLSFNSLGTEGAKSLAEALPKMLSLKKLIVPGNHLMAAGASHIAGALHSCGRLEHVDLGGNMIGDAGAHPLGEALPKCLRLRIFELANNRIGDTGVLSIGVALKECKNLESFDLSGNAIGKGIDWVIKAIPKCKRLKSCFLGHNYQIEDKDMERLHSALKKKGASFEL